MFRLGKKRFGKKIANFFVVLNIFMENQTGYTFCAGGIYSTHCTFQVLSARWMLSEDRHKNMSRLGTI
jgi:hypothetical protein